MYLGLEVGFEPSNDVVQPLLAVLRLPVSTQVVIFAWEPYQLRGNSVELESREELLRLLDGASIVFLRVYEQGGGLHLGCVPYW